MFFVRNAEALRWKGYYPLLRLWGEYPNELRAGPAAAVKSAVTPLLVLKEAPVDMNENLIGVNDLITILWNREKNREGGTHMAYKPEVDAKKCIGCEECVEVCPVDVYEIQYAKAVPTNWEECTGCESCIEVCESGAITITEI